MSLDEQAQPCHPYSLIPRCLHNPLLVQLIDYGVTIEMIDYVTLQTVNTVCIDGQRSGADPSLRDFIYRLVKHVNVSVGTLLTTVIYYDRIRPKLVEASGARGARHRLFLATLIVASKYLNDSSPKTTHWQKYANITTLENVNIMERQLLELLDFNLRFNEEEACRYFAPFMAIRAQQVSTRAIAVDKVTKASRARVQAQADARAQTEKLQNEQQPSEVSSLQPLPRGSGSVPAALVSAVKEIVKRPSNAQLARDSLAPPMHRTLSVDSSSSSSSDIGSLIDDTGSSSGSSSGWNTSDSESDSEEEQYIEPRVYSNSSLDHYSEHYPNSHLYRGGFLVRPIPSCKHKDSQLQNRSRKPSDASVRTVTATSPSDVSSHKRHPSAKRPATVVVGDNSNVHVKENPLSSSATMPSIPRTGLSGNFLSRMWGAAKAQAGCHEKAVGSDSEADVQLPSAFRRLVLVPSRSALSRTMTTSSLNV
ncbi:hypothetical protein L218DRAFT_954726 [Marasmius fiardii PR-910]|nr:hypothetical protein L218DRAFT_954726 [Marasmius fiardii PR-910]